MSFKLPVQNTVAIGGVGGSGTRLIAQIVDGLGFFIGDELNNALDNLYFTLLMKRPSWIHRFPSDMEVYEALKLFQRSMTTGLSGRVTQQEIDYTRKIAAELDPSNLTIGVSSAIAELLLDSKPANLNGRIGWGWKEPNTHLFLPQLATCLPDFKYIHIIRHGLDIAFSLNQHQPKNWNSFICGQALNKKVPLPRQSLSYWIAANRRAINLGRELYGDRFLVLNYDDLCLSPHIGIQILADFLNVEMSQKELEALETFVAPVSTGRWKEHGTELFTDKQLEAVKTLGFSIVP